MPVVRDISNQAKYVLLQKYLEGGILQIDGKGRVWRVGVYSMKRYGVALPIDRKRAEKKAKDGHLVVTVSEGVGGIAYKFLACELVWMFVHVCPLPEGEVISHIDGDKFNNSPDNLLLHIPKKRRRRKPRKNPCGEDHSKTHLTVDNVREMVALYLLGFPQKAIAELFNTTRFTMYDILKGRNWKHLNLKVGTRRYSTKGKGEFITRLSKKEVTEILRTYGVAKRRYVRKQKSP
jgi:hypothetical protein